MHDYLLNALEKWQTNQLVATAALLGSVMALRWTLVRTITRAKIKSADLRRRWIVQVRSVCFLLVALGLVVIWAPQLRTAALSVVAIMAAIVLATKELLLCLSGGFFKMTSGSFSLGDRIMVKGIRGEVIDQTLLSTTLLEIGPGLTLHQGTGRAVTIPNSVFLSEAVLNDSFTRAYVLHTFVVPIKVTGNWRLAEEVLLKEANEVCASFLSEAKRHMVHLTRREAFDTPSVDPRVTLTMPDPDRIDLVLRLPVPADKKGRVEQEVIRRYLIAIAAVQQTEPPPPV